MPNLILLCVCVCECMCVRTRIRAHVRMCVRAIKVQYTMQNQFSPALDSWLVGVYLNAE